MTNKNDNNTTDSQVDIDGITFAYRCDICWQELDDTDIQFKPCNRCHLQVCLFCFNKHTTRKESYAKTCPKCREPIDMDQIMKQNPNNIKPKSNPIRNNNKKRKRKNKKENKTDTTDNNNNSIDIDEEVPKTDWKNYLKGRFISRDSIIVAPVIAKFNNEEAISDNFSAYGRITRINMWDDESAHIMYDKQYFADALVDKIQDVAVRYQGQFGLMSAKYHFRRPCEEFMDPERRCPMQCRKFHGPYYKLDFIPLDQYLDEEARDQWILHRRKHVSGIVKARYKKFRKRFMDGANLPIHMHTHPHAHMHTHTGDDGHSNRKKRDYYDEYEYDYYEDGGGDYNYGYDNRRYNAPNTNTVTLKYNAMGKANKLLALDDSLQKHMRHRTGQPLPPTRPPPPPPPPKQPQVQVHSQSRPNDDISDRSESITGSNNDGNNSNSGSVGSQKRTRPPIHHTTSAQMRPFMASNPNIFHQQHGGGNGGQMKVKVKGKKVKKLMTIQKMCRTKSEESNEIKLRKIMQLRSTKSDPDCEYNINMHGRKSPYHEHDNGYNSHNRGDYNKTFSSSSSSLQRLYSSSSSNLRNQTQTQSPPKKSKTVDLLKSLKKKKRKQRGKTKNKTKLQPTRQPIPHHISRKKHPIIPPQTHIHHMNPNPLPKEQISTFKPHNNINIHVNNPININPTTFTTNNTINFNPYNNTYNVSQILHKNNQNRYSFKPNPDAQPFTAVSPKKSKLNANAASYKPLSATVSPVKTQSQVQSRERDVFKLPHMQSTIKSFDIRNLGPLPLQNNDILSVTRDHHKNVDYDFGGALNESHLDLKDHEDEKIGMDLHNEISSDDSSDDEYTDVKWTMTSLWNKLCDIINKQREIHGGDNASWCDWQNIRKLLKQQMSVSDWKYVKENKLVKKIKAKFRMEFVINNHKQNVYEVGVKNLLKGLSLKTSEAMSFVNLEYVHCSVIDIDLRISDIRNYMTDLLTLNRREMPSQYDTSIIAELGQILNIYQAWIDEKKREKNNMVVHVPLCDDGIKESDFYSRLLDEVQAKAMYEHGDHDYFDDGDTHNPKDLVMDYIGFNDMKDVIHEDVQDNKKNNENEDPNENQDENDELYQYEYSDDTDEQEQEQQKEFLMNNAKKIEKNEEKKEENKEFEEIAYDEDTGSHKEDDDDDDNKNDSKQEEIDGTDKKCEKLVTIDHNCVDDDVLYQYDDDDDEEVEPVIEIEENGIFSRVHSPPPRHRNNDNDNEVMVEKDEEVQVQIQGMDEEEINMDAPLSDRHYYNARYPPRRGRYGRNMESGNGGNGGYYRQRNQNLRYNVGNKSNINPPKMEWKKKEILKEMDKEKEKEKEIIINAENEENDNNNLNEKNRQETIENEEK